MSKSVCCVFFLMFFSSMVSLLVVRSIQCRFVAIVALASVDPAHISAAYAYQCPVQNGNKAKVSKIELIGKIFENRTRIVSLADCSPSRSMRWSGVPSKSFKCVRIRFSSPCFDKCTPRMEYQCSNSVAE